MRIVIYITTENIELIGFLEFHIKRAFDENYQILGFFFAKGSFNARESTPSFDLTKHTQNPYFPKPTLDCTEPS